MAAFLKKSPLRIIPLIILAIFILIRITDISLSITLNRHLSLFKHLLGSATGSQVSFQKIDFSLLGQAKFSGVSIAKDGRPLIYIGRLKIGYSPWQLFKRRIAVNSLTVDNARAGSAFLNYRNVLLDKLGSAAYAVGEVYPDRLPKVVVKQARVKIRNLKFYPGDSEGEEDFIRIDAWIKPRRENLFCQARLDLRHSDLNRSFLKNLIFYKFSKRIDLKVHLAFMRDDLLVNNLVFSSGNIKISGAGIVYDFKNSPFLDIKFISVPLNLREIVGLNSKIALNGLLDVAASLTGSLKSINLQTEMMMTKGDFRLPRNFLRLNSVFCNLQFKDNSLIVKELSGVVNSRYPVSLQGKVYNFLNPQFDVRVESFKTRQTDALTSQGVNFVLNAQGSILKEGFAGDMGFSVLLDKKRPHYLSERNISANIKNIVVNLKEDGEGSGDFVFDIKGERLVFSRQEKLNANLINSQQLKLDNLVSFLQINPEGRLKAELNGQAYEGRVILRSNWDLYSVRPGDFVAVRLLDLSVADIKDILPVNADISGRLNGFLYMGPFPPYGLSGAFSVTQGKISSLDLIDTIADFLQISSIKKLDGVFLATEFSIAKSKGRIRRLILRNDQISLNSSLEINDNQWASGQVSINLPKDILEESAIMKRLLSMVREKGKLIELDFKISGFLNALRVELLAGEFREKLMQGLSSGIRKQIEEEINRALDSLKSQGPS